SSGATTTPTTSDSAASPFTTHALPIPLQSSKEQVDQAAGVIAGIAVTADAEVADAAHQLVGVRTGPDRAGADRGVEQLRADEHRGGRVQQGLLGSQIRARGRR